MQPPAAILLAAFFVLVFLSLAIFLRHKQAVLRHGERMLAIERGATLPLEARRSPSTPRVYLLRGLLWLCGGVSLAVVLATLSLSTMRAVPPESKIYETQRLKEAGATEQQLRQYTLDVEQERRGLPLGVASLGLIPASVGLAYLLFYRKEAETETADRS